MFDFYMFSGKNDYNLRWDFKIGYNTKYSDFFSSLCKKVVSNKELIIPYKLTKFIHGDQYK